MNYFRPDDDDGSWLSGGERIWRASAESETAKAREHAPAIVLGEMASILAVALAIATVINAIY